MTAILVLDVGTTSVRAAIVDERLQIVAMARRPFPPSTPFPGLVEFDAAELARIVLDAAAEATAVGRSDRRRRHHQPAGEHDRVGPGDRRADRPGARLAGPAHRRRVHRRPRRARPGAGPEPVGDQARLAARPRRGRPRPRPVLRHRRHVAGVVAVGRRAARHRPHQRRRHRLARRRRQRVERARARRPRRAGRRAAGARRLVAASSARRPRSPAARRSPASSATSRRRSSARAASSRGGPRSRSAPAGCSTCAAGPNRRPRPSAASTARTRSSPGPAAATLTWGAEAIMLSAGTNVEWLRDDLGLIATSAESHDVAASVDGSDGVLYVPALLGLGHAALGLRRPRHAGRAHPGHDPRPRRARRARGRRPPRRRPRRGGRGRHRPVDRARCGSTAG